MDRIEILVIVILVLVAFQLFMSVNMHRNILELHSVHVVEPVPSQELRQTSFIKHLSAAI